MARELEGVERRGSAWEIGWTSASRQSRRGQAGTGAIGTGKIREEGREPTRTTRVSRGAASAASVELAMRVGSLH